MIELPVYNRQGEQVGQVSLDEADFGGTVRLQVLRDAIRMYEAARRVGTACTKHRADVSGTRAKPYRQKGTGRARAGFGRSPLWRGGAVVFGPKPRDYRFKMPRKAVLAARKSAFLSTFQDGQAVVIDELSVEQPRTKDVVSALAALGLDRSVLIAIEAHDANLWKSARNIPRVAMKPVGDVNAYDLLRNQRLLITRAALEQLVATLRGTRQTPAPDAAAPDVAEPPVAAAATVEASE